jgi:hypothetical protein
MSNKTEHVDLLSSSTSHETPEVSGPSAPHASGADPFDPSRLRLSQNFGAASAVKKRHTVIQVRKPGNQEFIRVHPDRDYSLETLLLELKDEGQVYLVDPPLWDDLVGELVAKVLYLTVNLPGIPRLWPIRLPDEEGKLDDWNRSALEAAGIAKKVWVRVSSKRRVGMYETEEARGKLPEPEWPDLSFQEILQIAFKGRFIEDLDHPVLRRLRGEV